MKEERRKKTIGQEGRLARNLVEDTIAPLFGGAIAIPFLKL